MNNIYVDELPKKCSDCGFCSADISGCWCQVKNETPAYITDEVFNERKLLSCPLELITDRLAEERKKVVQEIKDYMENHSHIVPVISKKRNVIYKIGLTRFLDQIERGE